MSANHDNLQKAVQRDGAAAPPGNLTARLGRPAGRAEMYVKKVPKQSLT
jgi:hypothetical protein